MFENRSLCMTYILAGFRDYCLFCFSNLRFAPLNSTQGSGNFTFGVLNLIVIFAFMFHVFMVVLVSYKNKNYDINKYDETLEIASVDEAKF